MIDVKKARESLEAKETAEKQRLRGRLRRAWSDFERIVAMLIEQYNPRRIYQWGSLLDEDNFSEISDIDIAVQGDFRAEEFFKMYGEATKMTEFSLDLLDIDKIEPEFADIIRMKGKVVYERENENPGASQGD